MKLKTKTSYSYSTLVFLFNVVDNKVMYEQNSFCIHCHKNVIFKLGNKAAVYNWFFIYKTT